jgi:uncharacterized RDD family membrane protein YckC
MSDTIQPELKPPTDAASPVLPIPGFLVRALALSLDVICLTILFYLLANKAYPALYSNRWAWQVLSMLIVAAYFTLGSSALARGQTIGKKVVGIRTVSLDGAAVSFARAARRGALVFAIVVAYVLLPQVVPVPLISTMLDMMWMAGVLPPSVTLGWILAIQIVAFVCVGYALATTFFLAMHPKKRALHDLVARTGVVYERTPEAGLEFLAEWNDYYEAKVRSLRWPTLFIGLIVLALVPQILMKSGEIRTSLEPIRMAERALRDGGFEPFALLGPSEGLHRQFVKNLEQREATRQQLIAQSKTQEAARYEPPSPEALRYAFDGRKFVFRFQLDESRTTDTLKADPRFAVTMDRLPALADELSREYFVERISPSGEVLPKDDTTSGALRPSPYTVIDTTFIEALPLFLYTKVKWTWAGQIPVAGHEGGTGVSPVEDHGQDAHATTRRTGDETEAVRQTPTQDEPTTR